MQVDKHLTLLVVAAGLAFGGPREREGASVLGLPIFPVPVVQENVPLTKALGDVGVLLRHGYISFGVELRVADSGEPKVTLKLPAGSTLGDALRQILEQLPSYQYEVVSRHLINIYPKGAKGDPSDLLNMRIARFDVVGTTPGEVISNPERFVPKLREVLYPGKGTLGNVLAGGPRSLTLHLQNVTLRDILNAASQASEKFPADLSPLGWAYTFQPKPGLPAGGVHSWAPLLTAPNDWKQEAK